MPIFVDRFDWKLHAHHSNSTYFVHDSFAWSIWAYDNLSLFFPPTLFSIPLSLSQSFSQTSLYVIRDTTTIKACDHFRAEQMRARAFTLSRKITFLGIFVSNTLICLTNGRMYTTRRLFTSVCAQKRAICFLCTFGMLFFFSAYATGELYTSIIYFVRRECEKNNVSVIFSISPSNLVL